MRRNEAIAQLDALSARILKKICHSDLTPKQKQALQIQYDAIDMGIAALQNEVLKNQTK